MKNTKILVEFYIDADGDTFAYFPELPHCSKFNTSYAHIGQHSACSPDYVKECKRANTEECEELRKELISIGYNI